jgi:hypothetical protein
MLIPQHHGNLIREVIDRWVLIFNVVFARCFERSDNFRSANIHILFIRHNLRHEVEVVVSHKEAKSYVELPLAGNAFYAEAFFGSRIVSRFASAALIAIPTRSASLNLRVLYLKSASFRYCCMYALPMW